MVGCRVTSSLGLDRFERRPKRAVLRQDGAKRSRRRPERAHHKAPKRGPATVVDPRSPATRRHILVLIVPTGSAGRTNWNALPDARIRQGLSSVRSLRSARVSSSAGRSAAPCGGSPGCRSAPSCRCGRAAGFDEADAVAPDDTVRRLTGRGTLPRAVLRASACPGREPRSHWSPDDGPSKGPPSVRPAPVVAGRDGLAAGLVLEDAVLVAGWASRGRHLRPARVLVGRLRFRPSMGQSGRGGGFASCTWTATAVADFRPLPAGCALRHSSRGKKAVTSRPPLRCGPRGCVGARPVL